MAWLVTHYCCTRLTHTLSLKSLYWCMLMLLAHCWQYAKLATFEFFLTVHAPDERSTLKKYWKLSQWCQAINPFCAFQAQNLHLVVTFLIIWCNISWFCLMGKRRREKKRKKRTPCGYSLDQLIRCWVLINPQNQPHTITTSLHFLLQ